MNRHVDALARRFRASTRRSARHGTTRAARPSRPGPPLVQWATALALAAAVVAALLVAAGQSPVATAATGSSLTPGAGRWIAGHTDFVGFYRARVGGRWLKVYCVNPDRRAPERIGLSPASRLGGSASAAGMVAETLSAHGNAATAGIAEAVSQAINYELGNRAAVARRSRSLSPAVRALAMRYVAEARRWRGPYALSLHLSAAPLPGQSGRATLTLRGPGGGRSAIVRLTHSGNVTTPTSVRLDAAGRAAFTYRTIGGGVVGIAAAAAGLVPATVQASRPAAGEQQMITWSAPIGVRASAHYQGRVGGFSQRYECTSTCNGHPRVTLTACAVGGTYPSRITYRYRHIEHRIDFAAGHDRRCRSWSARLRDGDQVSASWQFRTPGGWTTPQPAGGAFTVDCPAVPPVALTLGIDCHTAALTAVLGRVTAGALVPLRNVTRHRMVLDVGGAVSGRYLLAPGATAVPRTFSTACHTGVPTVTVTVRAGVQRLTGGYNYGPVTQVVLP